MSFEQFPTQELNVELDNPFRKVRQLVSTDMQNKSETRTPKSALVAVGLAALLVATAGCAATTAPAATEDTAAPADAAVAACAELTAEQSRTLDDAVAGELVSDSFGNYCKLRINPDAEALVYDSSKVDFEALEEFGFTEEDAKKAQVAAVTYLVEQSFDSVFLDNYEPDATQWAAEHPDLLAGDGTALLADDPRPNNLLLVSQYMPTELQRDGRPRATSITAEVITITAFESTTTGEPRLMVGTTATATYATTDGKVVESVLANFPDSTESSIEADAPDLFDDVDVSMIIVSGRFNYGYGLDDVTLLAENGASWSIKTGEGYDLTEQ